MAEPTLQELANLFTQREPSLQDLANQFTAKQPLPQQERTDKRRTFTEEFGEFIGEQPQNLVIGTLGVGAAAASSIKRRGIQLAGGLIPGFDQSALSLFSVVPPQERVKETTPASQFFTRQAIERRTRTQGKGALGEALGLVTRLPDVARLALQKKQQELQAKQDTVTLKDAPITRLTRSVTQGGVPSIAAAIGITFLTGDPLIGLAMLGETAGGEAFQTQLDEGGSVLKASIIGELSEAAEIAGEMLVFPKFIKGLKEGVPLVEGLKLIAENATQEGVTGFNQTFLEVYGRETSRGTSKREAAKIAFKAGYQAIPENAFVGGAIAGGVVSISGTPTKQTQPPTERVGGGTEISTPPGAITPEQSISTIPPQIQTIKFDEIQDPKLRSRVMANQLKADQATKTVGLDPQTLLNGPQRIKIEVGKKAKPREAQTQTQAAISIKKSQKEIGMNDADYRRFLHEQTGVSSTTLMTTEQLNQVDEAMRLQASSHFVNQTARDIGMTDQERNDITSRIKGAFAQETKRSVFNYYKNQTLPNDPQIRKRWLNDMKTQSKTIDKALHNKTKELDRNWVQNKVSTVNEFFGDFKSMRYWFSDIDVQTGRRVWEASDKVTHAKNKGVVEARKSFGDIMETHKYHRNTQGSLNRNEARDVAEYLFDLDEDAFAEMSPRAQKAAATLQDVFHVNSTRPGSGPAAVRLRSIQFKRWRKQYIELQKRIETESSKAKPSKKKLAVLEERQKKLLPKKATLKDMAVVDRAWQNGTYYEELAKQTFGTRKSYYMTDSDFDLWSAEVLEILKEPQLASTIEPKIETSLDDRSLNTRNGKGTPLLHKNPFLAAKKHLTRLTVIDELFDPVQNFSNELAGANLTNNQAEVTKQWLDNAAGKFQKAGTVTESLNFLKHQWWRVKGWTPTFMAKFAIRNLGQPLLGAAQVSAKHAPKWATQAYASELGVFKGNPFMLEDLKQFGDIEVSDKKQLYDLMALNEYSQSETAESKFGQLMDFGAQGFGMSDSMNRLIFTWPVMHQAAFDTISKWQSKQINTKEVYNRLKLDIMPQGQRQFLEGLLDQGKYREFMRHFANMKTKNVHYGYGTLERAAIEQNRSNKTFFGVMTWPRNAIEQYVRSGIKPMLDGAREGNAQKFTEGFKVFSKYLLVFAGLAKAYEELGLGDKMYGVLSSILYTPGSPELSTIGNVTNRWSLLQRTIQERPTEEWGPVIQDFGLGLLEIGGTMTIPIVNGLMNEWVIMAEALSGKEELQKREVIQQLWKDWLDIEFGNQVEEVTRTGTQKFMKLLTGTKVTEESEIEKEDRELFTPVKEGIKQVLF